VMGVGWTYGGGVGVCSSFGLGYKLIRVGPYGVEGCFHLRALSWLASGSTSMHVPLSLDHFHFA
jgi:hypothetical protein